MPERSFSLTSTFQPPRMAFSDAAAIQPPLAFADRQFVDDIRAERLLLVVGGPRLACPVVIGELIVIAQRLRQLKVAFKVSPRL